MKRKQWHFTVGRLHSVLSVFVRQRTGKAKRCVTCLIWCRRSVHLDWLIVCESSEWTRHSSPFLQRWNKTNGRRRLTHSPFVTSKRIGRVLWLSIWYECFVDFNSIFVLGAKCLINHWNSVNITEKTYSYINIYFPFYQWQRNKQWARVYSKLFASNRVRWISFSLEKRKLHNNNEFCIGIINQITFICNDWKMEFTKSKCYRTKN